MSNNSNNELNSSSSSLNSLTIGCLSPQEPFILSTTPTTPGNQHETVQEHKFKQDSPIHQHHPTQPTEQTREEHPLSKENSQDQLQEFTSSHLQPPFLQGNSKSSLKSYIKEFKKPKNSVGSPKFDTELPKRLMQFKMDSQAKIQQRIQQEEIKQMQDCTFHPKINDTDLKRPLQVFIKQQNEFQSSKKKKIQELREKLENSVIQNIKKPSLCKKSIMMIKGKQQASREILQITLQSKQETSYQSQNFSFTPSINRRSRILKREGGVQDILYDDAIRRLQKTQQTTQTSRPSYLNSYSQKLLRDKFTREFNQVFDALDTQKQNHLCYSLYIVALQRLKFIKNDSKSKTYQQERYLCITAWNQLVNLGRNLNKLDFFQFLMKVVNYADIVQPEISSVFRLFYENWNTYTKRPKHQQNYSFKPSLSQKTILLALDSKTKRIGFQNYDFLATQRQYMQQQWKQAQMNQQKEEIRLCQTKPSTNKARDIRNKQRSVSLAFTWKNLREKQDNKSLHRAINLYSLSRKLQEKVIQAAKDAAYDQQKEAARICPFQPNLRMSYYKGKHPLNQVRGTFELVERMRIAREERERLKQLNRRCQHPGCKNPGPLIFGLDKVKNSKKANRIFAKQQRMQRKQTMRQMFAVDSFMESGNSEDGKKIRTIENVIRQHKIESQKFFQNIKQQHFSEDESSSEVDI